MKMTQQRKPRSKHQNTTTTATAGSNIRSGNDIERHSMTNGYSSSSIRIPIVVALFMIMVMVVGTSRVTYMDPLSIASVTLPPPSPPSRIRNNQNHRDPSSIRYALVSDIVIASTMSAEYVWDQLLMEASSFSSNEEIVIIEVGMHTARQCRQAAQYGFSVHCLEPSPMSFARIQSQVQQNQPGQEHQTAKKNDNIHLYNMAASSESGHSIPFTASGSTGDHVGDYDMWNMQRAPPVDPLLQAKQGETIIVPTIRLDDIVANVTATTTTATISSTTAPSSVYLIKVDTQGFEPFVIQGMSNSLASQQIQFVLMEYWPRGMDLISRSSNNNDNTDDAACKAANDVLELFFQHGYTLYAIPPSSHPRAPAGAKQYLKTNYVPQSHDHTSVSLINTTATTIQSFCQWFYQVEDLYPSTEYKMGYWADVLAVAPLSKSNPTESQSYTTDLMKRIAQDQFALHT